jgi:hypothetical protein
VAHSPLKIIVACGRPRKGKSTICNIIYNEICPYSKNLDEANITVNLGNSEVPEGRN